MSRWKFWEQDADEYLEAKGVTSPYELAGDDFDESDGEYGWGEPEDYGESDVDDMAAGVAEDYGVGM